MDFNGLNRCFNGSVENYWGIDCALLPNRKWNQKQKPKKQPWSKVECFAFGAFLSDLTQIQISEDWFFAEGERFLSFWRCHRPRKRAALGVWCG